MLVPSSTPHWTVIKVADRSRNRVFRECNSFLVPTETVALPGDICGTVYVPGKYGERVQECNCSAAMYLFLNRKINNHHFISYSIFNAAK